MNLFAIFNLHNQTVLGRKGVWMSTANSKSTLRDVCWFDSLSVANAACIPYNPNTVTVLTAKSLCKRIGIKKIPGYIQENYRGSILARTMKVDTDSLNDSSEEGEETRQQKEKFTCSHGLTGNESETGEEMLIRRKESRYLELCGYDPSVVETKEISAIRNEIGVISGICAKWKERQSAVLEILKKIEARERDLLHIIEFYELKEEQAESAIQELHRVRCERRRLKNELTVLSAAIRAIINVSATSIDTALKSIEKLGMQKYYCRTITGDEVPGWLERIIKKSEKV